MKRVFISPEVIEEFKAQRERTQTGYYRLLSGAKNPIPKGLHAETLSLLESKGEGTLSEDQLQFVLHEFSLLPDQKPREAARKITAEIKEKIRATGFSKQVLFMIRDDVPAQIDVEDCIKRLSRKDAYLNEVEEAYLLRVCDELLQQKKVRAEQDSNLASPKPVVVNPKDLETLQRMNRYSRIFPQLVLKYGRYPPSDLTNVKIRNILAKKTKKALPSDVRWLLKEGRRLLHRALGED